jgi:hypothetical protein
MQFI